MYRKEGTRAFLGGRKNQAKKWGSGSGPAKDAVSKLLGYQKENKTARDQNAAIQKRYDKETTQAFVGPPETETEHLGGNQEYVRKRWYTGFSRVTMERIKIVLVEKVRMWKEPHGQSKSIT